MYECILKNGDITYKIGLNGKGQLNLASAKGGIILSQSIISGHTCRMFSCDVDERGIIHIAAVMGDKLTYYRYDGEKTSTTHLMRLPEKFGITSIMLYAGKDVFLYYCVKSAEEYAVIEYSLTSDGWQGKNLLTDSEPTEVVCGRKDGSECYIIKTSDGQNRLLEIKTGKEIFSGNGKIGYAQATHGGIAFCCGGYGYFNDAEMLATDNLYLTDGDRGYVLAENRIKEITVSDISRVVGETEPPRDGKEYILCSKTSEKRIILSTPYPYLQETQTRISGSGIAQEVYMQQRTVFLLQSDVKSLKNRVRKLEEIVKMMTNSK